jgi:outer membrane immunogenic protein
MRLRIKHKYVLLLTLAGVSAAQTLAQTPGQTAAQIASPTDKPYRVELAFGYTYLRSNAPPGGCGCFNMNGGNATFAWMPHPKNPFGIGSFALVGDVAVAQAGAISKAGDSLTLSTFTAGGRYLPTLKHSPLQPFGQALVGIAHSSGTLVQVSNPSVAFAANLGGGLDLRANRRFSVRLIEADYLLTTFDNGTNNHQNNTRISAGLVAHF